MEVSESAQGVARATLSEFLTDVLGSLVPGILFLTVATFAGTLLLIATKGPSLSLTVLPHDLLIAALQATEGTPSMLWVLLGLLFLITAYVMGHLFYRRDPKLPNRASFNRIAADALQRRILQHIQEQEKKKIGTGGGEADKHRRRKESWVRRRAELILFWFRERMRKWGGTLNPFAVVVRDATGPWVDTTIARENLTPEAFVRSILAPFSEQLNSLDDYVADELEWLRGEFACDSIENCEFPFPYIKRYLVQRNHEHLARYIDWDRPDDHRSKTAINRYKLAVEAHFPNRYRRLVRNEAHVRLSASTWYARRSPIV